MSNWLLNPGTVLLRRFLRNKGDPLCDEVDLIEANPSFARIRLSNGLESTVSTKDLAPCPCDTSQDVTDSTRSLTLHSQNTKLPIPDTVTEPITANPPLERMTDSNHFAECENVGDDAITSRAAKLEPRRSFRISKKPDRLAKTFIILKQLNSFIQLSG